MWTNVSIMVNKYTSRNLTEPVVEAPWNIMKYPGTLWNIIEHGRTSCQGITPSNSKGGLPAPEAEACTQQGGIEAELTQYPGS